MARENKYRTWNTRTKQMNYNPDYNSSSERLNDSFNWSKEIIEMQYTGRKDKNEVEVWEGDMLRDNSGEIYVVGPGGKQRTIKEPISVTNDFLWEEIIGNIYENSDIKL